MQPLDDINLDMFNQGPGMGALEFLGAMVLVIVIGVTFQWIISE